MSWRFLALLLVLLVCGQAQNPPLSERHQKGLAHLQQAAIYSQNQRDEEALVELEKAYELLPPSYPMARLLGEAYLKTGDPRAIDVWRKAVELNPAEEAWENFARALAAQRRFDEAIQTFVERVKADPQNTLFRLLLGEAFWNRSRFQEALAQFQLATTLSPDSARAHFWTGYAHQLLGHPDAARRSLNNALKLDPEHPLANLSMGHLEAGEGKWEEAIPFLHKYAEKKPEDFEVRLKLAEVYLEQQLYDEALAQLRKAKQLASQNKRVYYLLGRLYKATQQAELAKQAFATFNQLEAEELEKKQLQNAPYVKPN